MNGLVACSNGAFDRQTSTASHAWVFGDKVKLQLCHGAGPTDGSSKLLSSYHAVVSGILTLLYII
jgi:hypothetical protein